jgi:hypothetical protein
MVAPTIARASIVRRTSATADAALIRDLLLPDGANFDSSGELSASETIQKIQQIPPNRATHRYRLIDNHKT